jgi:hypothetical protein
MSDSIPSKFIAMRDGLVPTREFVRKGIVFAHDVIEALIAMKVL